MPHVLEVADRVQVMRLGTRVATFPAEGTTVEQLVGAMTGALDAKLTHARRARHERHRPRTDRPSAVASVADHRAGESCSSGWAACSRCGSSACSSSSSSFFSIAGGRQVPLGQQLLADLPEHRGVGGARRRDDLRHHHLRHRPVGRLGARVLLGRRREGHARPSAATAGAWPRRHPRRARQRIGLGHAQRLPDRQGQDPAADRHPRLAVGRPRTGPGPHRRHRHPLGARGADRLQHLHQDPRHSVAAVRRPDHRDHRRDRPAQDQVRPLHLRRRLQRARRPPGRHQRRPAPDPGLRACPG